MAILCRTGGATFSCHILIYHWIEGAGHHCIDVPDVAIADNMRKTDWGWGSQTQTKPVLNPNEAQVKPTTSEELPTMRWIADAKILMPQGGVNADQMPTLTSVCWVYKDLSVASPIANSYQNTVNTVKCSEL